MTNLKLTDKQIRAIERCYCDAYGLFKEIVCHGTGDPLGTKDTIGFYLSESIYLLEVVLERLTEDYIDSIPNDN